MSIHLRQVALVASELASAITDLSAIFGIEACHVDPALATWGLENTLLPVGHNFIELVAPTRDDTAAGRYLHRRGGDGGYMVICQTETLQSQDACRQRAAALGVRVAFESTEREGFSIMQLHPRDLEAAFFEIDWDIEADFNRRWEPAGGTGWEKHVHTQRVRDIAGVELQCEDPPALAGKWARIAGVTVAMEQGHPVVVLNNATLRFVPVRDERGPGLSGIDILTSDREAIVREAKMRNAFVSADEVIVCGTRFYLL
ncbi:MAG: VOC family protein [Burkholderiales bacterium]|jgi:hypothetical protein